MENIEQLAEQVIQAVEVLVDKRLRPITDAIAALRIEVKDAGYLKRDDIAGLAGKDGVDARLAGLDERVRALAADLTARPTVDAMRAESAAAASKAAADMVAALPKPADGKSVTVEDVRPLLEQMVAALPKAQDGRSVGMDEVAPVLQKMLDERPMPRDGKSVTPDDVRPMVESVVAAAVAALPKPADGKSVTVDDVRPLVDVAVAAAVAGIPKPADGKSVTADDVAPLVERSVAAAVAALPKAKDGASVTPEDVRPIIAAEVKAAVADLPRPADGKSVTIDEITPVLRVMVDAREKEFGPKPEVLRGMVDDAVARAVSSIPKPADGKDVDLATLRDLVSITVKAAVADIPVPKDGERGKDADPVDMGAVVSLVEGAVRRAVEAMPTPRDGVDAMAIDDFMLDLKDDGRTLVFRFAAGGREKTFEIVCPWQIYRGVWKAGAYMQGDTVTYGGSQWVARCDTSLIPGTDDWVLAVKRGKDGKDGSGA